jgi:hypothetical protein
MKQSNDQPLAIESLKLCTKHKTVSTIVAIIERTAAYCLCLFHNAKNFVASDKKQLQHLHDDGKLHNHLATNSIIWHFLQSAPNFAEVWEAVEKSMKKKRFPDF